MGCLICGEKVRKRGGRGRQSKYCSVTCYRVAQRAGHYRGRGKTKPCDQCGKPTAMHSKRRFCSRECYLEVHTRQIKWTCAGCGTSEMMSPYHAARRKYCSHACRVASKKPDPVRCKNCGVLFTGLKLHPSGRLVAVSSRATCSDECALAWISNNEERKQKISAAFTGENHPNWLGGRSANNRNHRGRGWQQIAAKVRKRDGYRCTECGATREENGRILSVHHIEPYHNFETARQANRISNLTTLCRSCHHRREAQIVTRQLLLPLAS